MINTFSFQTCDGHFCVSMIINPNAYGTITYNSFDWLFLFSGTSTSICLPLVPVKGMFNNSMCIKNIVQLVFLTFLQQEALCCFSRIMSAYMMPMLFNILCKMFNNFSDTIAKLVPHSVRWDDAWLIQPVYLQPLIWPRTIEMCITG